MNHGLTSMQMIGMTCEESRRYYTMLADLDEEQARLEGNPGELTLAEFHARLQAIKEYRATLKAVWSREHAD